MNRLLKYSLPALCFSGIVSLIVFIIGDNIECKQRNEFEREREEWVKQNDENKKRNEDERLQIWLKLEMLVSKNPDWGQYHEVKRESLLERLDISDDDTYAILMTEGASKKQWMRHFVKENYHRNSKERKLLREYDALMPGRDSFYGTARNMPERLSQFDVYKKCLPDRLSFIYKQSPEESAWQVFAGVFFVFMVLVSFYAMIKQKKDEKVD